jgi:regulator of sirC expression with transglutaminase-like and TPR domain
VQTLIKALTGGDEFKLDMGLDLAALELATIEFPDVVPGPYLERLDHMALELAEETAGLSGSEFTARANILLFEEIGFRGNEQNYYDARNSCLNWVLDQRMGIPITLSLVYIEVARRVGRPVFGIPLPGHFVVQYDDGKYSTFLDPFNGGKLLNEDDCWKLARNAGAEVPFDLRLLRRAGTRHILIRMLNNLRAAYFQREDFVRAVKVLNLLIQSTPNAADYYKGRGIANIHIRQFRAARADFEQYLRLEPGAEDRDDIVKQMAEIHRWVGTLN